MRAGRAGTLTVEHPGQACRLTKPAGQPRMLLMERLEESAPLPTVAENTLLRSSSPEGIKLRLIKAAAVAACAAAWAAWAVYVLPINNPWLNAACLVLLSGSTAAFTGGFLISAGAPSSRGSRAGLAASAVLALVAGTAAGWLAALAGLAGALAGSLLFTSLRDGLWEDNYPPSALVQAEVYRLHQEQAGPPRPVSVPKRIFDILLSALGLIVFFPLIVVISLGIWIEDPGPVLFIKNSVGRGGRNFHQFKFRTMIRWAEKATGPVLSHEADERVLWMGRFLRKTALDELPQFANILRGEMSFVGPRPQRTVLVHGYLQQIPGYACRHAIAPGLAGLAQVVGSYFMPPEEKLVWDLRYIEKASLGYDLKLVGLALLVVFWLRWQKDWDEHIPEKWLS